MGVIDIDYDMLSKHFDKFFERMETWQVDKKFAWFPVKTDSGKKLWFKRYIKRWRYIEALRGDRFDTYQMHIFTPHEYTIWLLKQGSSEE